MFTPRIYLEIASRKRRQSRPIKRKLSVFACRRLN